MQISTSQKLTLLNRAVLESINETSISAIIKKFTNTGIQILGADFGFAWLKSGNKKYKLAHKSRSLPYEPKPPRKNGINYWVTKKGVPFFATNIQLFKKKFTGINDILPYMKGFVIIPISYKNANYGNIVICFKRQKKFFQEDKGLCTFLGNSAARSITIHGLYFSLKDFKDTLDKTLDSIFIFNPETLKIEYANDGASEQLGLPRSELYRRTMVEVQGSYKHEEFRQLLRPLLRQQEKFLTAEGSIKNSQGRRVSVEMFLQFIRTPGQAGKILSIVQDITERKRLERESRHLLKQKDEFLSIASHELKTPITTIKGFAQLLETSLLEKNNDQKYFVQKINTQVGILTRLVNDLLDISRIETGKLKIRRRIFELSRLIESLADNLRINNARHKIILKLQGQFWLFGDADRIGQVLINLITNAIKYSPRARRVIVSLKPEEGGFVKVSVEDFGIGVDKKKQQKIFERFFQGQRNAETYPGLGLGLYIASNIIKSHKGKIFLQNKKTKGAIFSFILPYKRCLLKKRKN